MTSSKQNKISNQVSNPPRGGVRSTNTTINTDFRIALKRKSLLKILMYKSWLCLVLLLQPQPYGIGKLKHEPSPIMILIELIEGYI